jgi:hypothetical protein
VLRAEAIPSERDGEWRRLLASHPGGRAIVPRWDEIVGWKLHRIGLTAAGKLEGGLVIGLRRIPRLPFRLSRISCVMLPSGQETFALEVLLREVERFALRHLVLETELVVRIPTTDGIENFEYHQHVHRLVRDFGYRPLDKVDRTYFVRIDRDDEALLGSFESTTRNRIKKAKKMGAVVGTSHDYALLHDFYESYVEMGRRKGAPIPMRSLVDGMIPLLADGHALLVTESYEDKVSNMLLIDALGVPWYALGARTPANVRGDIPSQAQVMHYEVMRMLRDRGRRYYDLGGCEGPVPVEGHQNFGVWRFKYGFRGTYVQFLPHFRKTRGRLFRPIMDAVHRYRGDYVPV